MPQRGVCASAKDRGYNVIHQLTVPRAAGNLVGSNFSHELHMPTYDYHCTACNHAFSRTESVAAHERASVACPKCKSTKVERTLSPFYAKTGRKS